MSWLSGETLVALATLTFLEIVLGVDNIIFISILSSRLPAARQPSARRLGLLMAMGTRILLLFSLAWVVRLTSPLFSLWTHEISGRDLILIGGGLFLLAKSTLEGFKQGSLELGPPPADLCEVLAKACLGSPAIAAFRAFAVARLQALRLVRPERTQRRGPIPTRNHPT